MVPSNLIRTLARKISRDISPEQKAIADRKAVEALNRVHATEKSLTGKLEEEVGTGPESINDIRKEAEATPDWLLKKAEEIEKARKEGGMPESKVVDPESPLEEAKRTIDEPSSVQKNTRKSLEEEAIHLGVLTREQVRYKKTNLNDQQLKNRVIKARRAAPLPKSRGNVLDNKEPYVSPGQATRDEADPEMFARYVPEEEAAKPIPKSALASRDLGNIMETRTGTKDPVTHMHRKIGRRRDLPDLRSKELDLEGKAHTENVEQIQKILKDHPEYNEAAQRGIVRQIDRAKEVDENIGKRYGTKAGQSGTDTSTKNVPEPNVKNLRALFNEYIKKKQVSGKELAEARTLFGQMEANIGRRAGKMGRTTVEGSKKGPITAESMARQLPQVDESRALLDELTDPLDPKVKAQTQSVAESQAAKQASLKGQRYIVQYGVGQPTSPVPIPNKISADQAVYKDWEKTVHQLQKYPEQQKQFVETVQKLIDIGVEPGFAVRRARAALGIEDQVAPSRLQESIGSYSKLFGGKPEKTKVGQSYDELGNLIEEATDIDPAYSAKATENLAFKRTPEELSKARREEGIVQGQTPRQTNIKSRRRIDPTIEQEMIRTLEEVQAIPSQQANPELAFKAGTPINQKLIELFRNRGIDPSNPIILQILRRMAARTKR